MCREFSRGWLGVVTAAWLSVLSGPIRAEEQEPQQDASTPSVVEAAALMPVDAAPASDDGVAAPVDAGGPVSVEAAAPMPVDAAPVSLDGVAAPVDAAVPVAVDAAVPVAVEAAPVSVDGVPAPVDSTVPVAVEAAPVSVDGVPAPVDAGPIVVDVGAVPATAVPQPSVVETPKCEPERKAWAGLGLKLNAGWGKMLLVDPLHEIRQTPTAQMLGVSWAPFNITGEFGFSWLYNDKRWLANRADLRFFFLKGSRFSQYLALNADFGPTKKYRWVGAGVSFGFEALVVPHVAVFAVATVEAMSFPAHAAPKVTPNPDWRREPKMFLYGAPSAVAGLQFRL